MIITYCANVYSKQLSNNYKANTTFISTLWISTKQYKNCNQRMQQRSHIVFKCYLSVTYSEALTSDKEMCIV